MFSFTVWMTYPLFLQDDELLEPLESEDTKPEDDLQHEGLESDQVNDKQTRDRDSDRLPSSKHTSADHVKSEMYSSDSDSRDSAEKLDKSRNFNSTSKTAAKQDATQSSSSVLNNAKGAKSAGPKSKSNITNQVTGLQETKLDMLVEKGVEMLPGVVIGGAGGEGEHEEGGVKRTDSRKSLDEIVASSVASVVAASNISQPDAATSKAEQKVDIRKNQNVMQITKFYNNGKSL